MNPKQSTESCVLNWESFSNTNIHCCMSGSSLHLGLGFFLWRFYPFLKGCFAKPYVKNLAMQGLNRNQKLLAFALIIMWDAFTLADHYPFKLFLNYFSTFSNLWPPLLGKNLQAIFTSISKPPVSLKKQIQTPIKWAYSLIFPPDAVKIALHYPPNFMMYPLHWTLFYFGLMPTISCYYWICECFWVITDWTVWINAVF